MKDIIKKFLNEALFDKNSQDQIKLLEDFVSFACKSLKIPKPPIHLKFNREGLVTTAAYGNQKVLVYAKERAVVDIMRSIAHELTHMKQDVEGRLKDHTHDGAAGSPIENEANFRAGELIRKFGELHPEMYK